MIWKGIGATGSPDPKRLDVLIGKELNRLGFKGSRDGRKCIFASLCPDQAFEYALNGHNDFKQIIPKVGSLVSWSQNTYDHITALECHFNKIYHSGTPLGTGRTADNFYNLMMDCQGGLSTLETYLSYNRQKKATQLLIQDFVATLEPREIVFQSDDALTQALGNHKGEIWITGKADIIRPQIHVPFTSSLSLESA